MGRVIHYKKIHTELGKLKDSGSSFVIVGGVFDIIHPFHIKILEAASEFCDALVVNVLNDKRVTLMKNPQKRVGVLIKRPIIE